MLDPEPDTAFGNDTATSLLLKIPEKNYKNDYMHLSLSLLLFTSNHVNMQQKINQDKQDHLIRNAESSCVEILTMLIDKSALVI